MAVAVGDKLGPYEILAPIGAGGMGEVFRARDTRLGREVAIKMSDARFSERFEREARAVAALNHPNICTLYDVGPNYLVMEYVEGNEPKGPYALEEALRIARQIADALEAAHGKGIVHRDLKPANVKIKPDGSVKVLDFGLATALPEPSTAEEHSILSTEAMRLTQTGVVLGTPAYMAPEQASGKNVDKRAYARFYRCDQKISFVVSYGISECQARIRNAFGYAAYGYEFSGNHNLEFQVWKRIRSYQNSFAPVLSGRLIEEANGTRIKGGFGPHRIVRAMSIIWFAFVIVVGGQIVFRSLQDVFEGTQNLHASPYVAILVALLLPLCGLLIVSFGKWLGADEQVEIIALLKKVLGISGESEELGSAQF